MLLTRRNLLHAVPGAAAGLLLANSKLTSATAHAQTLPNPVIMGNMVSSLQTVFSQYWGSGVTTTSLTNAANAVTMMSNEFETNGLGIPAAWTSAMQANVDAIDAWIPTSSSASAQEATLANLVLPFDSSAPYDVANVLGPLAISSANLTRARIDAANLSLPSFLSQMAEAYTALAQSQSGKIISPNHLLRAAFEDRAHLQRIISTKCLVDSILAGALFLAAIFCPAIDIAVIAGVTITLSGATSAVAVGYSLASLATCQ